MNLYCIRYDGVPYFIEAPSFATAIDAWREHMKELWGEDYEEADDPHSVEFLNDDPVIRYAPHITGEADTLRALCERALRGIEDPSALWGHDLGDALIADLRAALGAS